MKQVLKVRMATGRAISVEIDPDNPLDRQYVKALQEYDRSPYMKRVLQRIAKAMEEEGREVPSILQDLMQPASVDTDKEN